MKYIYTLTDPRDGAIRYVGETLNPIMRLRLHIAQFKTGRAKDQWIKELEQEKLRPVMNIVEEVPVADAKTKEREWIVKLRGEGCLLLQSRNGGDARLAKSRGWVKLKTKNYNVHLDPVTAEHAKTLPGGLSGQLRAALQKIYEETKPAG